MLRVIAVLVGVLCMTGTRQKFRWSTSKGSSRLTASSYACIGVECRDAKARRIQGETTADSQGEDQAQVGVHANGGSRLPFIARALAPGCPNFFIKIAPSPIKAKAGRTITLGIQVKAASALGA